MEKMKAIYLVKHGNVQEAFEIREIARPVPDKNQVLVKVEGFGLNFADVMARRGLYKDAPPIPSVLGYDVIGKIVDVGPGVEDNLENQRIVSLIRFGGYAEYAIVETGAMAIIPPDMHWAKSLALATQYCTAYYASGVLTNFFPKDYVLIHSAAGGVGIALTQLAKNNGCMVIGTAGSQRKIDFIKNNLGADYAINYEAENYAEKIESILGKKSVDLVFNSLGGKSFKQDFGLLKQTGRIVCYGASSRISGKSGFFSNLKLLLNFGFYSPIFLMMGSRSIMGINMLRVAKWKPEIISHCLNAVVNLHKAGKIDPVIAKEFEAEKIGEAHAFLESRNSIGKIALHW